MAADTMNSKRSAENENVLKVAKNKQGEPITIQIGKTYSIKVVSVENGQCDQCGERGPAKYETDEDDPDNPFPPLIYNAPSSLEKKRQKRPAVGMAQQLLNDFIVWLRLGGWKLTPGSYDSVAAYLNELPELIKVDCWFGKNTETATKLFQSWHGNLKVDGKIGPKTWKELILFSDAYSLLYDKSYPEPRTPPDAPDLYAVPGLGSPDDSPVLLASNDPLFLPVADSGTAKVCCAKMYSKAKNFSELVQLVKDAEV
ncbi:MAG: peptidoglycan-binding protein, partial [Chitinispirillaceae bacterium]|nr:peptidoglycan-binding protein [Chitinispirillaceae bacterium]